MKGGVEGREGSAAEGEKSPPRNPGGPKGEDWCIVGIVCIQWAQQDLNLRPSDYGSGPAIVPPFVRLSLGLVG